MRAPERLIIAPHLPFRFKSMLEIAMVSRLKALSQQIKFFSLARVFQSGIERAIFVLVTMERGLPTDTDKPIHASASKPVSHA